MTTAPTASFTARFSATTDSLVALSGYPRASMGARAMAAGCSAYIEKPTEPVRVLREIEARVGRPPLSGVGEPPRIPGPLS
jgi:AmiR/NasT family two-component response regulator